MNLGSSCATTSLHVWHCVASCFTDWSWSQPHILMGVGYLSKKPGQLPLFRSCCLRVSIHVCLHLLAWFSSSCGVSYQHRRILMCLRQGWFLSQSTSIELRIIWSHWRLSCHPFVAVILMQWWICWAAGSLLRSMGFIGRNLYCTCATCLSLCVVKYVGFS